MFKTILWGTDGSENADRALPVVKALAEATGATVVVAHCREVFGGRAAGIPVYVDEGELLAKIRAQAADLESLGFDVQVEVVTAAGTSAPRVIAELARGYDADLIAVGTRGHSPFVGMLLGSVTQRLLHIAPCPVLAVSTGEQVETEEPAATATTVG
jgi:nucleotide-binding universal stress UspA family protein